MLNDDVLLETLKSMSLNDIKNYCKVDKRALQFCKDYKNVIFKDVVYTLEYIEFQVGNPEETFCIEIKVYDDIKEAVSEMNLKYELKIKEQLIEYSVTNGRFSKVISQDTTKESDMIYKWKVSSKKIIRV